MSAQLAGVAPDVRAGQRWRARQTLKNACIRVAIGGLLRVVDALPAGLVVALGRALGRAARFSKRLNGVAVENVSHALGVARAKAVTTACFANAGEVLARTLLLRREGARPSDFVELDEAAAEQLRSVLRLGRGALVLSAHYGPFEHIAPVVAEHGITPAIVVRESYDPALDPVVDAHRLRCGVEVVHRGREPLGVLGALRRGRPLGLLVDLPGRVATRPVRFLGHADVPFPLGAASLSARLAVPVLLGLLVPRKEGGFRLFFEDLGSDPSALTQRVAARLDAHIRQYPEHWLWMARPLARARIEGRLRKKA
ncbi:MAG TPA: lysophospholipid acyltransferase family protein [Polyangiaceae bacterium]|nr:lysophospholipid acyltransferase family protein [Polyangiaceae bacterium]